jgi:large subunit ribosomal protein L5
MAEEKKNGVSVKKAHNKGNQKAKYISRLETKYQDEIVPAMMKEFKYSSILECPKIVKVILNMRLGEAGSNEKSVDEAVKEMETISGQHPIVTKAKKSIANFKLREGVPVGVKVTLRRVRMYDFLDKFISIDLPRVRDFRGISKDSFDGRGNYSTGVKEQLIFPEIQYDKVGRTQGMDVVIVTSANTDKEAYFLLSKLGMPFRK